jgi:hypothetical protein
MNQTSNPNIPTIKRWSRPTFAPTARQHAFFRIRKLSAVIAEIKARNVAGLDFAESQMDTGKDSGLCRIRHKPDHVG